MNICETIMFLELVEMGFVACLLGWSFVVADRDYYKKELDKNKNNNNKIKKNNNL